MGIDECDSDGSGRGAVIDWRGRRSTRRRQQWRCDGGRRADECCAVWAGESVGKEYATGKLLERTRTMQFPVGHVHSRRSRSEVCLCAIAGSMSYRPTRIALTRCPAKCLSSLVPFCFKLLSLG